MLAFDGQASHLILHDSPRERLFSKPYAFILDFLPEPGASGTIFRRHHCNCLSWSATARWRSTPTSGAATWSVSPRRSASAQWNRIVL